MIKNSDVLMARQSLQTIIFVSLKLLKEHNKVEGKL